MIEFKFKGEDKIKAVAIIANSELDNDKDYVLTVKEYKAKKSLSANAYFWVLCGKLAEKTHIGSTEIYKRLIKEIGGNNTLVCVQEDCVDALCSHWAAKGLGWVTETVDSKLNGCKNVFLYYGSSLYDSTQMSRLIDLIVQECKQQGIETMTPQEIAALMGAEK